MTPPGQKVIARSLPCFIKRYLEAGCDKGHMQVPKDAVAQVIMAKGNMALVPAMDGMVSPSGRRVFAYKTWSGGPDPGGWDEGQAK